MPSYKPFHPSDSADLLLPYNHVSSSPTSSFHQAQYRMQKACLSSHGVLRFNSFYRRTKAALSVWKEMRENASTPSTVAPFPGKRKLEEETLLTQLAEGVHEVEKKQKQASSVL